MNELVVGGLVRARERLDELKPLLAECDNYDEITAQIEALKSQRVALPYFFASAKAELLSERLVDLRERINTHERKRDAVVDQLSTIRALSWLRRMRSSSGGKPAPTSRISGSGWRQNIGRQHVARTCLDR